MNTKVAGSNKELFDEIINTGLCTLCGACSGSCPYLIPRKGKIMLLDNCTLSDGQCYQYCPRTYTDMDVISQLLFGVQYSGDELGTMKEVLMVRSTDTRIRDRAQYGGTVTTLLSLALTEGLIDSAVLSRMSDDKTPTTSLARNTEEILQCAGSNYMACPVLEVFNEIPKDSEERLGIVVLPCQALSLAKMKKEPPQNRVNVGNIKFTIGLFCTWALSSHEFHTFLKDNLDLTQVTKFDIPPPPENRFDIYIPSDRVSFPLEQIREFIMPTCTYCLDMTAEFADISVGSVEGFEGWNTVIVRTEAGAELMEMARAKGILDTGKLFPENLAHLKEAALLKKKRALDEIVSRTGDKRDLLYLGLSKNIANKLLD